jgi:hypothetical protein
MVWQDASREALMSEWREVVGRPPPKHLSRPLMVQILSHTYQLGRFVWKDQSFKSLSHTARAITGYNVSGFQFFGVRP